MEERASPQCDLDPARLKEILPDGPGVYLFKDSSGRVIYVGKAKNLKKRVLSYFRPAGDLPHKTAIMMSRATGIDFILTSVEKEAFILEDSLVKKFMPRYNIILRDDKRYPCLRLDVNEPYPRLTIVRRIKKDGARYFGPFSSALSVRSTLKVIERVFQLRKCKGRELPKRTRPCLNYQMGRCLGACTRNVPVSEYREVIRQVILFLEGRSNELIGRLKKAMNDASEHLDFEKAARIRDQITAIERTVERQHVVSRRMEDQDILAMAASGELVKVVILFVRKGVLIGTRDYTLRNSGDSGPEVMEAFLKQYYPREAFVPGEILISEPVADLPAIMEWLSDLGGKKVFIHRPVRGEKLRLVKMAVTNAENLLLGLSADKEKDLLGRMQSALNLKNLPRRIEGLDISNFQGAMAVGTIVSFVDGFPHRSGYRNYRIRSVGGIDDYGMMAELVSRRVSRGDLPDLFLVDGGKGHLAVVQRVLENFASIQSSGQFPGNVHEIGKLPEAISIAKESENGLEKGDKIYIQGRKNPLALKPDDPVLLLLMQIRDEAHRRAITYHRKLRSRRLMESALDLIPGIGPKRKRILLKHFPDIQAILGAGADVLARIPTVNRALAEKIVTCLKEHEQGA